jgi:hypothetical protein
LNIAIVGEVNSMPRISDHIRTKMMELAPVMGFRPSVLGLDLADVLRLADNDDPSWFEIMRDAVVLVGSRPQELLVGLRTFDDDRWSDD